MDEEKIYRIPKNLNADFELFACYTIIDVMMIFLLFAAGFFCAYFAGLYVALVPAVLTALLRFRFGNYTLWFWLKSVLQFLLRSSAKHCEYTLFEGGEVLWK